MMAGGGGSILMADSVAMAVFLFLFLVFRDKICYAAQSAIKLVIQQPQPFKHWITGVYHHTWF